MKFYCKNCGTEFRFRDNIWNDDNCPVCGNDDPDYELFYIPDYETLAQYEKRTSKVFPEDGAVWKKHKFFTYWECVSFRQAKEDLERKWSNYVEFIVIADPPVPPPADWEPEGET